MKTDILEKIPEDEILYRELLQRYALHPKARATLVNEYAYHNYDADPTVALECLLATCASIEMQIPPHVHALVEEYIVEDGYAAEDAEWLLRVQKD